jgi:putative peptide zinc metalloprotease protein
VTTSAEVPVTQTAVEVPGGALDRADGVELLGSVHGSGYKDGAALVRRADGQMVQLGPLMYAFLECVDGRRTNAEVAGCMSDLLGRHVGEGHVVRLAEKLAAQGLLAGTEHAAPARRNPLLALRWKVLVTNPQITSRLTAPFAFLFRPWLMWPVVAAFVGVCWFVLVDKGVAGATAQAMNDPGLLLLVFALTVVSAGFHELGHAAACKYGGATPGGMGMGLYLVWPAFYTDVTDAYRLDKRSRLRVDLAGLYFNAVVAVITMGVWLFVQKDALLLLVALQLLQMIKQLSPVIRADGYHILSDATGVPDLYSHMGPTLRHLIPGRRREASALTGKARLLVTCWVLVMIPVLLSLMLGAVLLLPKLATTAWESGRHIADGLPHEAATADVVAMLASLLRLLALVLPVAGSALVTQRIVRGLVGKARSWSSGRPVRRSFLLLAAAGAAAGAIWAWWPSGQYHPIRAGDRGTIGSLLSVVTSPSEFARPPAVPATVSLAPGHYLALSMIPVGGATKGHPALLVLPGRRGRPPVAIVTDATAVPPDGAGGPVAGAAFPFVLPSAPGPGGTQALAVGTREGGVTYSVAYSLVTVTGGAPVTETNSAYALADCKGCTTVAVSVQVVLVVGQSDDVAPIDAAGALNVDCPSCSTTAIADQIVVTLDSQPSRALESRLEAALAQLGALPELGANGTPAAVASEVGAVQQQLDTALAGSGLMTNPPTTATTLVTSSTTAVPGESGASTTLPGTTPSGESDQTSTTAPGGTAGAYGTSPTTTSATTFSPSSATTTPDPTASGTSSPTTTEVPSTSDSGTQSPSDSGTQSATAGSSSSSTP